MTNGELDRSQVDATSEIKPTVSRNPQLRRRGGWTTGKVLAWVGAVFTVIGTLVAIIALIPRAKEKCGEEAFLAQSSYQKYSEKSSSQSPTRESLYTSGEPKDAEDVIIEQSPELTALSQALRTGQPFAPGQMIFLYGAGGSGKTVVIARLRKDAPQTAFLDVGQQFKYNQQTEKVHERTELKPELTIHGQVISQMPALKDDVLAGGLEGLFKAAGLDQNLSDAKNIIVDSLDELYPASASKIIDTAMEYVTLHHDKNVVLAGRGETFRAYFEKESYSSKNFRPIHLKPMFVGEEPMLTWFVWQTLRYEHERNKAPGAAPSKESATKLVNKLEGLWKMRPELRDFMVTLSPANFLIGHIQEPSYNSDQLSELLFYRTAERNRERHYRPLQSDGELWRVYNDILQQIARIAQLREDGSFVFPVQQTVKVKLGSECVDVNAPKVLNLSELADLEPFDKDHLIYRFFPRSFQKYLAEKRSGN